MLMVDDLAAYSGQRGVLAGIEFTEKYAVLHVLAVILEDFKKLASAFIIRHIVGAEVKPTGVVQRTTGHVKLGISPRSQRASNRACTFKVVRHEHR